MNVNPFSSSLDFSPKAVVLDEYFTNQNVTPNSSNSLNQQPKDAYQYIFDSLSSMPTVLLNQGVAISSFSESEHPVNVVSSPILLPSLSAKNEEFQPQVDGPLKTRARLSQSIELEELEKRPIKRSRTQLKKNDELEKELKVISETQIERELSQEEKNNKRRTRNILSARASRTRKKEELDNLLVQQKETIKSGQDIEKIVVAYNKVIDAPQLPSLKELNADTLSNDDKVKIYQQKVPMIISALAGETLRLRNLVKELERKNAASEEVFNSLLQ